MRRKAAAKRTILPDPKYGSEVLSKFVNHLMLHGEKSVAERIVYNALEEAFEKARKSKKTNEKSEAGSSDESGSSTAGLTSVLDLLETVLGNIRPTVEVKSRRVGGSTYQVPIEVNADRSMTLAMRWLIEASKKRSEKSMMRKLASEMLDAYHGRGAAVKKRDDTHRMAKANQAFAHYRW